MNYQLLRVIIEYLAASGNEYPSPQHGSSPVIQMVFFFPYDFMNISPVSQMPVLYPCVQRAALTEEEWLDMVHTIRGWDGSLQELFRNCG